MILLKTLAQREKSPAEGKKEKPYSDIYDVHTPSSYALCCFCQISNFLDIHDCGLKLSIRDIKKG
jgi:hypothetical protein